MELLPDIEIKEECGVFGMFNPNGEDVANSIYYGLSSLQHRGQESCGIAVCDTQGPKGNMNAHKGMGLVSEVFKEDILSGLHGNLGIGHVRYSTTGAATGAAALLGAAPVLPFSSTVTSYTLPLTVIV